MLLCNPFGSNRNEQTSTVSVPIFVVTLASMNGDNYKQRYNWERERKKRTNCFTNTHTATRFAHCTRSTTCSLCGCFWRPVSLNPLAHSRKIYTTCQKMLLLLCTQQIRRCGTSKVWKRCGAALQCSKNKPRFANPIGQTHKFIHWFNNDSPLLL